jgi:hypothetical protein
VEAARGGGMWEGGAVAWTAVGLQVEAEVASRVALKEGLAGWQGRARQEGPPAGAVCEARASQAVRSRIPAGRCPCMRQAQTRRLCSIA